MICRYKKITYFCTRVLCPGGGIGRRAGLKIQCPQQTCGFDSRPGYAKNQEVKLCLTSFFVSFRFVNWEIFFGILASHANRDSASLSQIKILSCSAECLTNSFNRPSSTKSIFLCNSFRKASARLTHLKRVGA